VHGFVVPAAWPAPHQKPAGHGTCAVLGVVADGQKKPAAQLLAVAIVLPSARQRAAAHAPHEAKDV